MRVSALIVCATVVATCAIAPAQIRITEWAYSAADGEFVELTNVGGSPVDFTGWSYDDDSVTPGVFDLSGFGMVAPGESVVFTENTPAAFSAAWSLPATVKVLGGVSNNLGRADQINIYDGMGVLADVLSYGDAVFAGTIRTQDVSGNPASAVALGVDDVGQWVLSSTGDSFGSYVSAGGAIGNPGVYSAVPEPTALLLVAFGIAGVATRSRR